VGEEADREETLQARRRGARQQDGAHRLRDPAEQDGLSGNSSVAALVGFAARGHQEPGGKGIEGDQEVMRGKRIDPEARGIVCSTQARCSDRGNGSADNIRASGSNCPHAMVDLATLRVFEFGIGDVLNLNFSRLGVDDAAIFAHDKPHISIRLDCERPPPAKEILGLPKHHIDSDNYK
jgi:hypothetical protein